MTLDVRDEARTDRWMFDGTDPATDAVVTATELAPAVSLDDLMAAAELLTRVDRKYFVPASTFSRFAAAVADEYAVLDIEGRRLFAYESVYFDTPDLLTYRAHVQGRRRRFKLRTRTYLDSGICLLEVKVKGPRGVTIKTRTSHAQERRRELGDEALAFVTDVLHGHQGLALPPQLAATMTTTNHRATFVSTVETARFTCDVGLRCRTESGEAVARDDFVLVETKSGVSGSHADRVLRQLGVRTSRVSKYCVGVGVLHPELSSNPWHRTVHRYFADPVGVIA